MVEGRTAPIVGRISMDQMQIDLTDIPDASVGAKSCSTARTTATR